MQRALVFDYDGLIVDTESATYDVWRSLYREHGQELTVTDWLRAVGHVDNFDPHFHLEQLTGRLIDRAALEAHVTRELPPLVAMLPPLPGVIELMRKAKESGWRLGVASNSDSAWVLAGLQRLGLNTWVEAVRTRDDVSRHKPFPDVYLAVLEALGADPGISIAFEDSAPGAEAARSAGLYVVAVPNTLTRHLSIPAAHTIIDSLAAFTLPD